MRQEKNEERACRCLADQAQGRPLLILVIIGEVRALVFRPPLRQTRIAAEAAARRAAAQRSMLSALGDLKNFFGERPAGHIRSREAAMAAVRPLASPATALPPPAAMPSRCPDRPRPWQSPSMSTLSC